MTRETRPVIVCNGYNGAEPCERVFNKGDVYITLTLRATRSDLPRPEVGGMERFVAENKAGLRKEVHLHPTCTLPQDVVPTLLLHAGTVVEWPELTEND